MRTESSTGPNRTIEPGGTGIQTLGARRVPFTCVPLLEPSSRTRNCPPSSFTVAWKPETRASWNTIWHWAASRPTRISLPGRIVNTPAAPDSVARDACANAVPPPAGAPPYGSGGGALPCGCAVVRPY